MGNINYVLHWSKLSFSLSRRPRCYIAVCPSFVVAQNTTATACHLLQSITLQEHNLQHRCYYSTSPAPIKRLLLLVGANLL